MTSGRAIDLNADLGEGFGVWRLGDDDALLGIVTSANVACGFHAGDPSTMRRVCTRAAAAGVAVGAQVSYRDLAGFGRRFLDVEPAELADDVLYQLAALDGIARATGGRVVLRQAARRALQRRGHPRGARPRGRRRRAAYDRRLPVLGLPGSALLRAAEAAGMRPVSEGFADRGYTPAGTLVPRRQPGALVHDPALVAARAVRMAADGVVETVDGTTVLMPVESICVHGDTPGAVALARAVRTALEAAGLTVPRSTVERSARVVVQESAGAQPAVEQVRGDVVDRAAAAVGVCPHQRERRGRGQLELHAEHPQRLPHRGAARGSGPCIQSGPSAGSQVDHTAASLSAEVTSSPTASASKTSRPGTSSERSKKRSIAPVPGQSRLEGQRHHRAERRRAEQQVGEDRPPAHQVLLGGEHRLAGLLGGRAGPPAGRELQPLGQLARRPSSHPGERAALRHRSG